MLTPEERKTFRTIKTVTKNERGGEGKVVLVYYHGIEKSASTIFY